MDSNGWNDYHNGNTRVAYRVLKALPWYIERKDSNGKVSPVESTILCLYYGMYCKMYGIEYSISCLDSKELINNTPEGEWVSFSGDQLASFINIPVEFVIKYKNITISNEFDEKDFLKDVFMRIKAYPFGYIHLTCWRQEVQYEHVAASYIHSHIPHYNYTVNATISEFCLGSKGNGTNAGINAMRRTVSSISEMFGIISIGEEVHTSHSSIIDRIEYNMSLFTGALLPLLQTESITGVPHAMMRYAYLTGNWETGEQYYADDDDDDYDDDDDDRATSVSIKSRFVAFANRVCKNIGDPRIKYRIHGSTVEIIPSSSLVSFAKEHGFFNSCFAFQNKVGSRHVIPAGVKPALSSKEIEEIDNKMRWLKSPFEWNGELLQAKAIHLQNTFQINDSAAKIHYDYTSVFNQRVKDYFEERLISLSRNPFKEPVADMRLQVTGNTSSIDIRQSDSGNNQTSQSS